MGLGVLICLKCWGKASRPRLWLMKLSCLNRRWICLSERYKYWLLIKANRRPNRLRHQCHKLKDAKAHLKTAWTHSPNTRKKKARKSTQNHSPNLSQATRQKYSGRWRTRTWSVKMRANVCAWTVCARWTRWTRSTPASSSRKRQTTGHAKKCSSPSVHCAIWRNKTSWGRCTSKTSEALIIKITVDVWSN